MSTFIIFADTSGSENTAPATTFYVDTNVKSLPAETLRPPHWMNDSTYTNSDLFGNAELVEAQNILFESEQFSFISVQTKLGNVFYIFIDRRIETANVYFLNKVDEYDLLSLIYSGDDSTQTAPIPAHSGQTGGNNNNSQTTGNADVTTNKNDKTTDEKSGFKIPMVSLITIIVLVIGGIVGAIFYFTKGKNKSVNSKISKDDYDIDDDNDEYSNDEE
jgi:hypothetical protein